jgi:hypothetical protein
MADVAGHRSLDSLKRAGKADGDVFPQFLSSGVRGEHNLD